MKAALLLLLLPLAFGQQCKNYDEVCPPPPDRCTLKCREAVEDEAPIPPGYTRTLTTFHTDATDNCGPATVTCSDDTTHVHDFDRSYDTGVFPIDEYPIGVTLQCVPGGALSGIWQGTKNGQTHKFGNIACMKKN